MDNEHILTANGDLYHWGIKGMRWGVRRYQNKDGSLTKAGKKRYDSEMEKIKAETKKIKNQQRTAAKLKKLEDAKKNLDDLKNGKEKKAETAEEIAAKKAKILESRSAKQLYDNANLFTTAELTAAKTRLELERNIKSLEPATIDKGKAFANKFIESADQITSVVQSGTKTWNAVAKVYNGLYGNKNGKSLPMINDSVTSKLDKFKEETDWLKAKNERKKAEDDAKEKPKSDLDKYKEETDRLKAENDRKAAENRRREVERTSRQHDESDAEEAASKAKKEAKKEAKKDSDNTKESESKGGTGVKGEKWEKRETSESKVYEGTVEGVGNSSRKNTESKQTSRNNTVIDADWYEVTTDRGQSYTTSLMVRPNNSFSTNNVNRGQSYIAGLLEEPKGLSRR